MSVATDELQAQLRGELETILGTIPVAMGPGHPFWVPMPDPVTIDYTHEDLASLVARSANAYARIARFAGLARAHAKLAKSRYERISRLAREGRNEDERAANAMRAAAAAHDDQAAAEAIAEVADGFEAGARIASESARKIYDKAVTMAQGVAREERGRLRDRDFSTS